MDKNQELLNGLLKKALNEGESTGDPSEVKKQSEKIASEIEKQITLFVDDLGDAYARIDNNGHFENWPLSTDNNNFKTWIAYHARKKLGQTPCEASVKEVITILSGQAKYETDTRHKLFNRVACSDDGSKFWYDITTVRLKSKKH